VRCPCSSRICARAVTLSIVFKAEAFQCGHTLFYHNIGDSFPNETERMAVGTLRISGTKVNNYNEFAIWMRNRKRNYFILNFAAKVQV
jgi:hypothetical protein